MRRLVMLSLEIRRFGSERTLGLILGILLVGGVVALAASASHPGINYH